MNEGAILAARKGKDNVDSECFESATERVIAGLEIKRLDDKERKVVAYHESGHAVVSWFLKYANPLVKVTIIPRSKGALGFTQYVPDNIKLHSREHLLDQISTLFGGRVVEELLLGSITTGATDDLQKATVIAHSLVTKYGMSKLGLRFISNNSNEDSISTTKPYSEKYEERIDEEVKSILEKCYKTAKDIVVDNKDRVINMSEELLSKETLDLGDIIRILGDRPFPMEEFMKDYLSEVNERKRIEEESKKKKDEEGESKKDDKYDKKKEGDTGGEIPPKGEPEKTIHEAERIIK